MKRCVRINREILKQWRIERNLTQTNIANDLKMYQPMYSDIETGVRLATYEEACRMSELIGSNIILSWKNKLLNDALNRIDY